MRSAYSRRESKTVDHRHRFRHLCSCGAVYDVIKVVPGSKSVCKSTLLDARICSCFFAVRVAKCFVCSAEDVKWDDALPEPTA